MSSINYPIYLDYASTTPVDKRVLEEMLPYFTEHFGNAASRFHAYGWKAEEAVTRAREQVAALIGSSAKEITFTGGATESVNLALKGAFEVAGGKKSHFISVKTEHKASLDTLESLQKRGAEVTYLKTDENGLISLQELEAAIRPDTLMVSVMWVNNETGLIQPIAGIGEIAHKYGVLFHTDATQAAGKLPVNVQECPVDLLSFSGHKIYGPKGVGGLYVKHGTKIAAQQDGGRHERGRRSGTLNVSGIAGLGKASEIAAAEYQEESQRIGDHKRHFEEFILGNFNFCGVVAQTGLRAPGISNVCFRGFDGEELLLKLNQIAISNGSACNSASTEPSHVLKAIGMSDDDAYSSLRFSFGRFTTAADIENLKKHLKETLTLIPAGQV